MSQPRPVRSVHRAEGWTPATLAEQMLPALEAELLPARALRRRLLLGSAVSGGAEGGRGMDVGILAFGAYVPRLRLARKAVAEANAWFNPALRSLAKGERAICNWDEDSVTMAVEAARDCLAGRDRGTITAVYLASTS